MKRIEHTIELLKDSTVFYTLIINMAGCYEYVSKSYDDKFRFLGDSLRGKPFDITLHPEDRKICEATGVSAVTNPGHLYSVSLRKHDGEGGFIHTHWEFKAILVNEQVSGVFCLGYNTTEHVATSAKLLDAEDIIQHKNQELEEIGFTQSHIVRRPIANLLGLLEVLDNSNNIDDYKHIHSLLKDSVSELDKVVKQINDQINL